MNVTSRKDKINETTKIAWQNNWKEISVEKILTIFEYTRVKEMLATYEQFFTKNDRILEAGCGLGPWLIRLTQEGYDVTGIDYDPVSLGKIKAYDNALKVFEANVKDIPFKEGAFDVYLSFGVIEHFVEGPDEALKEAYRVLANNGRAVITVPYKNIFVRLKMPVEAFKQNALVRRLFKKESKTVYYQKYFDPKELVRLVEKQGFKVERLMPLDHIFSLVSFSGIFRDKTSYDGENKLAIRVANVLKKIMPWASADSTLIIARKVE